MTETALVAPRPIHWAGTMTLGVVWGSAFLSMAVALEGLTPLWVAAGRLALGAIALLAMEALRGRPGLPQQAGPVPWGWVVPIGALATALPFTLLTWGLQTVPSGFAGVSMAAVALFVLPLAHVMVPGESLTPQRAMGVGAGFLGVVILIGPGAFAVTDGVSQLPGRLACIGAALCYAVSSILTRLCPPIDPVRLTTLMTITGTLIMLPVAFLVDGAPGIPGTVPFLALLWVGLFPTALANLLRVLIVRSAGPSFMSMVSYLVPLWAVIFGVTLLGEPLTLSMITAMALILGGIGLSQLPRKPRNRQP